MAIQKGLYGSGPAPLYRRPAPAPPSASLRSGFNRLAQSSFDRCDSHHWVEIVAPRTEADGAICGTWKSRLRCACKTTWFMGRGTMAEDELTTPQQPLGTLLPGFSLTRAIGGKLRALYDDDAQPPPSRMTDLLSALDRDQAAH